MELKNMGKNLSGELREILEEEGRCQQTERCWNCGRLLVKEERDADHDACFDCYCEPQD